YGFDPDASFFARIGGGSLGGKARGLAFVRLMLGRESLSRAFPGVHIAVPSAIVLATDCFDRFLAENGLWEFALGQHDDAQLERRFLAARLPGDLVAALAAFVAQVKGPPAVRSSSLLEDSQYQPFSGVYDTLMLANDHDEPGVRLEQLTIAVRRVYAS